MDLVVLHGPPGIGKRTIAEELVGRTGFGLLAAHHLGCAIGPVFGWGSPTFNEVRDSIFPAIVERAIEEALPGLVFTFIFEPTVRVEQFEVLARDARRSGGRSLFVGLTCDREEHLKRAVDASRAPLLKWTDADGLGAALDAGLFDFPHLPEVSVVLDTTGRSPEESADEITRQLAAV
jgi:hypothetical protein